MSTEHVPPVPPAPLLRLQNSFAALVEALQDTELSPTVHRCLSDCDESIKSASSETEPSLSFMVDQGGGSFTAYLFGDGAKELGSVKSVKNVGLFDPALLAEFKTLSGFDLIDTNAKNTFNDISVVGPDVYPCLTKLLASAYEGALAMLLKDHDPDGTLPLKAKLVRQTGKMRAVLLLPERVAERTAYCQHMNSALKFEYSFALLTNQDEAEKESGAFFSFNESTSANTMGLGIGSSSTQGYALNPNTAETICAYDTVLGSKPTAALKASGKSVDSFAEQFRSLLEVMTHGASGPVTLYCLNSLGYLLVPMTEALGDDHRFTITLRAAEPMPVALFLEAATEFNPAGDVHAYKANCILGLAKAISAFPVIHSVILERKGSNGKAIDIETSWIKYEIATQDARRVLHDGQWARVKTSFKQVKTANRVLKAFGSTRTMF